MVNRYSEEANEELRKMVRGDARRFARICDTRTMARVVDAEPLSKTRMGQYYKEAEARRRMLHWDQEEEDWEKMRDQVDGTNPYIELGYDSLAKAYFDEFGEGFNGEKAMSNEYKGWTCPKCGMQHRVPANSLPEYCWCGMITPFGRWAATKRYKK